MYLLCLWTSSFHLHSVALPSVSHETSCHVFLYSHLYNMFVFWNMFDQDDQNRDIKRIIDGVLLFSIFRKYSYLWILHSNISNVLSHMQYVNEQISFLLSNQQSMAFLFCGICYPDLLNYLWSLLPMFSFPVHVCYGLFP